MPGFQTLDVDVSPHQVETRSFSPAYQHHQRVVSAGPEFTLPANRLKWYQISRSDVDIPAELIEESKELVRNEVESRRLDIATEQGFVMLHLGDEASSRNTFAMLFVCTWRRNNELWRTLYTKSLQTDSDFELYRDDGHVGAFCVWEMAPVWHEREAWSRFLFTARDRSALEAYLSDVFEGTV